MEFDCLTLEIRILANRLYQTVMADMDGQLTMHQSLILGYVITHNERQITQKEIEELFSIRRSTANHMFQLMEKNGYIRRDSSLSDARAKVIVATELGIQAHNKFSAKLIAFEKQLRSGFSKDEMKMFRIMMRKLWNNINTDA